MLAAAGRASAGDLIASARPPYDELLGANRRQHRRRCRRQLRRRLYRRQQQQRRLRR